MKKQTRYHVVGTDRDTHLFEECGDTSGELYRLAPCKSGQPINGQLVTVTREDEEHFRFDAVELSGPVQVATPAYRKGWADTFGGAPN